MNELTTAIFIISLALNALLAGGYMQSTEPMGVLKQQDIYANGVIQKFQKKTNGRNDHGRLAIITFRLFFRHTVRLLALFRSDGKQRPPKPHTTCKNCVHRNKKECPFSHIECDVTGDSIFWHTNKQDDFYCKDAKAHEPEKL